MDYGKNNRHKCFYQYFCRVPPKKYIQPEEITAPRQKWTLIKVLFKGAPEDYSIALGKWEGHPCLAMRWNAYKGRPVGHPHTRGLPTWFVIPKQIEDSIISTLSSESKVIAAALLRGD